MVQPEHQHPPCWNCVDRDFSRDWNQLSRAPTDRAPRFLVFSPFFPESSGAESVVVREDGCGIENKREEG